MADRIEEQVPEGSNHLFVSELYGRIAIVRYGDNLGRKPASWDQLSELIEKLPAEGVILVKDGSFTSFKTAEYVQNLPEEKKVRWTSETEVSPILLQIEWAYQLGPQLQVQWFSKLPDVGMIEVNVDMGPLPSFLSYPCVASRQAKDHPHCRLRNTETLDIHNPTGETLAMPESPIRWAKGDSTEHSRYTVYWQNVMDELNPAMIGRESVRNFRNLAK